MRGRRALLSIGAALLCVTLAGCAQLAFWPFSTGPDPAAVQEAFLQGEQAVLEQDYAAAAAAFEQLLGIDPDNAEAMLWLGRCRMLLGDSAAAADVLQTAHDKAPGRADILRYLAKALLGSGELVAAEKAYLSLMDLDPGDTSAYTGLERVYVAMGDQEKLNALRGMPLDTPIDDEDYGEDYLEDDDGWISVPVDNQNWEDDDDGWATIPPELLGTTVPADPTQTPEPVYESIPQPTPTPVPYDPNMPQVEDETGWDEYGG